MYRELNLRVPEDLYTVLDKRAKEQGVSIETLCFYLLSEQKQETNLTDPNFYPSLTLGDLRKETRKVIESNLPREEVKKRVNALEVTISGRYIR